MADIPVVQSATPLSFYARVLCVYMVPASTPPRTQRFLPVSSAASCPTARASGQHARLQHRGGRRQITRYHAKTHTFSVVDSPRPHALRATHRAHDHDDARRTVVIPADELRGASMTTVTERTMLALRDAIVGSDAQPGYRADVGELPSFVADLFQQPLTLAGTAALPSSGNRLIPSRVAVGAAHIWITLEVATNARHRSRLHKSVQHCGLARGGGRVVSPDRNCNGRSWAARSIHGRSCGSSRPARTECSKRPSMSRIPAGVVRRRCGAVCDGSGWAS